MAIIQKLEMSTEERCLMIKLYAINWIIILDMYWVVHIRVYNTTEKDNPLRVVVVVIVWLLDLQLPMQSVPITTDVVRSNLDKGEVYNIMW
jgi:hypothetical protein